MSENNTSELKRTLPLSALIFYGLAFMVPLTIFTTYGIVTKMTHGMVSISYLVATVAMAFSAFSYVRMVKAYPVAGSVYTYVNKSINQYLGFLSGWMILIGYMFLPMLNYLISAIFLSAAIPQVQTWVWIIALILMVTVIDHFGIRVNANLNSFIIWVQIAFLGALMIFLVKYIIGGGGAGTFMDFNAFINIAELGKSGMGLPIILSGASILALSFLGFDAISTLSEDAIDPEKNITKAIIIACIGSGIAFTLITYFLQLAWPSAWFEIQNVDGGAYELITKIAGSFMGYLFTAAYVIGCLASSASSVSSASRILYGMGRDGIIPRRFFTYLHPKHNTPTFSILLIALLGLLSLVISLSTAASLLNFGALIGFTMVNISVIAHYFIKNKRRHGMDIVRYLIAPACGAVINFIIWIRLDMTSMMLGFAWLAVGIVYLLYITKFFSVLPPEMALE